MYTSIGEGFGAGPEAFTFFVALFFVLYWYARKQHSFEINNWAGIAGLLCILAAGFWVTELRTPHQKEDHLSNLKGTPAYYTGVVNDYVIQKPGYQRTVLLVDKVLIDGNWQQVSGQVQVSVPHDTPEDYTFTYGDKLLIKGTPLPVASSLNPSQFDYKAYLQQKGIYHRHNLQVNQFEQYGNDPPNFLLYVSIQIRRFLEQTIKLNIDAKREASISTALILGVKDELENDVRDSYAATGTMHVLAVSGMHVGLIFGVFLLLFKSIRLNKSQRVVFVTLVVVLLLLYAFVTGLSASVLRAVLMFSLVMIAMAWSRRQNIYNTLAFVAFLLLFYDPYFLFDVGFQLSYLAVIGIVALHPGIYGLLYLNNRFLDKAWELFSISVAAQLITLPLGIYYFHQFPVYFWLANIVVVPVSTLGLYAGVVALVLHWVPFLSDLLFALHAGCIWLMNEANLLLSAFPGALINGLSITALQAWLLYGLLFALVLLLTLKKLRFLYLAVGITGILAVQQILEIQVQQRQKLMAVYSLRGNTAIAFVQGNDATLLASTGLTTASSDFKFNVQPHLWELGLQQIHLTGLYSNTDQVPHMVLPDSNSLVVWNGLKMLLISKPPRYLPATEAAFDYLVLSQNVRLKPADLEQLRAKKVILDASNAPWYVKRLQPQLQDAGLPYHSVATDGAYLLQLK